MLIRVSGMGFPSPIVGASSRGKVRAAVKRSPSSQFCGYFRWLTSRRAAAGEDSGGLRLRRYKLELLLLADQLSCRCQGNSTVVRSLNHAPYHGPPFHEGQIAK